MSKKTKESLKIVSQERIGKDIYGMEASCFPAPSVSVKLTEKTEESVLFIG